MGAEEQKRRRATCASWSALSEQGLVRFVSPSQSFQAGEAYELKPSGLAHNIRSWSRKQLTHNLFVVLLVSPPTEQKREFQVKGDIVLSVEGR